MKGKTLKMIFASLAGLFALSGAVGLVRDLVGGPPFAEKSRSEYYLMGASVSFMIIGGIICHRLFVSAFAKPGKERLH